MRRITHPNTETRMAALAAATGHRPEDVKVSEVTISKAKAAEALSWGKAIWGQFNMKTPAKTTQRKARK